MWLKTYIDEITAIYGISSTEAQNVIIETAEQFYTHLLRHPVVCEMTRDGITIRKYSFNAFSVSEDTITLQSHNFKSLSASLKDRFETIMLFRKHKYLSAYIGKAIRCTFLKYDDGAFCFTEDGGAGKIHAVCSDRNIPPKERNRYSSGQNLWFIASGLIQKNDQIIFRLSRTSMTLVDELFKLNGSNVKCIKRIPGAKSYVHAEKHIPKKQIVSVAGELNERIIVEF